MALTKAARNKIFSFVQQAKKLLFEEMEGQLQQHFGIRPDGTVLMVEELTSSDPDIIYTAGLLRNRLDYLKSNIPGAGKKKDQEAVRQLVREQAFTILNRFASLRMAEERDIIRETVRQGYNSEGFLTFDSISGESKSADRFTRYKWYILAIFDELAQDLPALYYRFSPYFLLFPGENALLQLLGIINDEDLSIHREPGLQPVNLWKEDETIGWVYQYYNSREEIKAMRDASNAPRNSRELAVRNQFFTPRYVVQFLTDNSLGRIWYEMTQGQTKLAEICEYLVRQPNEVFLQPGETAPKDASEDTTYIPHRPLKDPREIRMLDPACGSMHFGLYAFNLYELIYLEAWDNYPDLLRDLKDTLFRNEFVKLIPSLIIRHNIHGVDIDPRAVQIAGLSLWLRAQKSYQRLGLQPAERPAITKANLVCAEPMPGNQAMLEEFLWTVDEPLRPLIRTIWESMKLAGETGMLLKIEEELKNAIAETREEWVKYKNVQGVQGNLFGMNQPGIQLQMNQLAMYKRLKEDFFEQAEDMVLNALQEYAETATNGSAYQKGLFAEDTARGFAFIDLCRKRYDVVLMNPPFGACAGKVESYLNKVYKGWNYNIFCCFVIRALELASWIGSITDRAYMLKTSYSKFRLDNFINSDRLKLIVDLGWEVLDANVEVNLQVFSSKSENSLFLNLIKDKEKDKTLLNSCKNFDTQKWVELHPTNFIKLPDYILSYDLPKWQLELIQNGVEITENYAEARSGLKAGKVEQFVRLWWETPDTCRGTKNRWNYFQNGGSYAPFYQPTYLVVYYEDNWNRIKSISSSRITGLEHYWNSGISYGKRTDFIYGYPMPKGQIFSNEGMAVFPKDFDKRWEILAFINSTTIQDLMNFLAGQHKAHSYFNKIYVQELKMPNEVSNLSEEIVNKLLSIDTQNETSINFCQPPFLSSKNETFLKLAEDWVEETNAILSQVIENYQKIDNLISIVLKESPSETPIRIPSWDKILFEEEISKKCFCKLSISFLVGVCFGRWDFKCGLSDISKHINLDAFAELPTASPAMLTAEKLKSYDNYPIKIYKSGVLELDNKETLSRNLLFEASTKFWNSNAESILLDISEILGFRSIFQYLNSPNGFFNDHLDFYSKGRRQAPIYWLLSSKNGGFSILIYYPHLKEQTLFTIINNILSPKLEVVQEDIRKLRQADSKSSELNPLLGLEAELRDFKEKLLRIAQLPYKPNHDDGVLITAAPLNELFPHPKWRKATQECWEKLEAGEYDWAHLAYAIWPDRVREKCKTDLSMAIAHGLEDICEVEVRGKNNTETEEVEMEEEEEFE